MFGRRKVELAEEKVRSHLRTKSINFKNSYYDGMHEYKAGNDDLSPAILLFQINSDGFRKRSSTLFLYII